MQREINEEPISAPRQPYEIKNYVLQTRRLSARESKAAPVTAGTKRQADDAHPELLLYAGSQPARLRAVPGAGEPRGGEVCPRGVHRLPCETDHRVDNQQGIGISTAVSFKTSIDTVTMCTAYFLSRSLLTLTSVFSLLR